MKRPFVSCMTVLVLLTSAAAACSCVNPGDDGAMRAATALRDSDLVFLADVSGITDEGSQDALNLRRNATATVATVFKGNLTIGQEVETSTSLVCCLCGYNMSAGRNLVSIHSASSGPPYDLSSCLMNCPLMRADGSNYTYCTDTVAALSPAFGLMSKSALVGVPGALLSALLLGALAGAI